MPEWVLHRVQLHGDLGAEQHAVREERGRMRGVRFWAALRVGGLRLRRDLVHERVLLIEFVREPKCVDLCSERAAVQSVRRG